MRAVTLILLLVYGAAELHAQRRGANAPTAAFAIEVTDPDGQGLGEVDVMLTGPTNRTARTEAGRIALEGLRPGPYLLRFEREGFVTLERELSARAGKPTPVKVTLKPAPAPPPTQPTEPDAPPPPPVDAKPMFADVPGVLENEFLGRAPSRTTPLACGTEATSSLIQLNAPLETHAHDAADEVFYVVAGEGTALVGTGRQRLKAGIFLFVPRGMPHGLTPSGRNPLMVLSVRAGEPCR